MKTDLLKYFAAVLLLALSLKAQSQPNLQKPFDDCGQTGSIVIYDYKLGKWTYSNPQDAAYPTLPASTFKIINSLIALETGVIPDEFKVFKWDGKKRTIEAWNANTDMKNAFKNSTVWYYVELAKRIGKENYASYLKKCNYGNADLSEPGHDFWNYGKFAISPTGQINFLKAFYEETLPFSKRTYEIVKRIMIEESNDKFILRAKTGLTQSSGKSIGWYVGYVERKGNVYFFAMRLMKNAKTEDSSFSVCRKSITRKVLHQMGITN